MFASVSQCMAFVLLYVVYNIAVNFSGSRSFPAYKESLSHCFTFGIFSPNLLVLWFQVMTIISLRLALAFVKFSILSNGSHV